MLQQLQSLLLCLPPEAAHQIAFKAGKVLQSQSLYKSFEKNFKNLENISEVPIAGMHVSNPIGLAAGFDKNAELIALLSHLGFGFLEVGTVTPLAQKGNPKPRLFRLSEKKSLVNRMGFNNAGADRVAQNIEILKPKMRAGVRLGINIGKNKLSPQAEAALDYQKAYEALQVYADYIVVNISSPNTPGLRDLQSVSFLEEVRKVLDGNKPVFVKLAPELEAAAFRDLLLAIEDLAFDGLILTNTLSVESDQSLLKKYKSGGISGELLRISSREKLLEARKVSSLPIISVGGVDSADEAIWRLQQGATAVQIYTALIYYGHDFIFRLLQKMYKSDES